jgi:hypothetical protein
MAGSVAERNSGHPQIRRFNQWLHLQAMLRPASPPVFNSWMPGAANWTPTSDLSLLGT